MSDVIEERTQKCRHASRGCDVYAEITRWSCGCVRVNIYGSSKACSGCTNFSGMRKACGKARRAGTYPDGTRLA